VHLLDNHIRVQPLSDLEFGFRVLCNLHDILEVLLHICTTPTHLHTQRQTPHPHKTPKAFVSPEENLVLISRGKFREEEEKEEEKITSFQSHQADETTYKQGRVELV
jgi:hypothetical protein